MTLEKLPFPLQALLFLVLLPVWIVAAFFARGSRRTLPEEPAPERVEGTDFIVPVEQLDPDEETMFNGIINFMVKTVHKTYEAGSGDQVPEIFEDGHGLTTCLLRGSLEIDAEGIAALPEPVRVGLLAKPGTYPLIGRFNVIDTTRGVVMASRLSLKIHFEGREIDLITAGYIPPPLPNFFIRDATDMSFVAGMPRAAMSPNGLATAYRLLARNIGRVNKYVKSTITDGPFGVRYGSLLPYRLGPATAKWHVYPKQEHPIAAPPDKRYAAHQGRAVERWFDDGGRDVSFDLSIQVATVEGTPGPVRCVEDAELRWEEDTNPVYPVGRLHFPATSLETMVADFGPPKDWAHRLRFEIGNTLDEHQPLGQNNRLRKKLYRAHSDARRAHLHGLDAPTMTDPFGLGPESREQRAVDRAQRDSAQQ